jgi:hypothetical protein
MIMYPVRVLTLQNYATARRWGLPTLGQKRLYQQIRPQ